MRNVIRRLGLWNIALVLLVSSVTSIFYSVQSSATPTPIKSLSSIFNFRDMSTSGVIKSGLIYRSAQLCQRNGDNKTNNQLSSSDQTKLAGALEGGAIIDLRDHGTAKPQEWKDCPDPNLSNVKKVSLPAIGVGSASGYAKVFAGKEKANASEGKPSGKESRANIGKALETIADTSGPVLFHCTYGKDRTGWTAAMVLYIVGADYATIKADYLKSNDDLPSGKKVDIAWLESALKQINKTFAGSEGIPSRDTILKYLQAAPADVNGGLGVSSTTIAKIKAKLSNGKTSADSSGVDVTVGSYNLLGWYHKEYPGDSDKGFSSKHLTNIANNIKSMKMNVVGLQEYRDTTSGKNQVLDTLGGSWKAIGPGKKQLMILYDSSVLTLIDDDYIESLTDRNGCEGGDPAANYAKFKINSNGQEFLVVNFHPPVTHSKKCNTVRLNVVKEGMKKSFIANYTGPTFVIGDFNSAIVDTDGTGRNNIYGYLTGAGYKNSIETAKRAVREKATIGNGSDWKRSIDFVYYKNIGAPSYYQTLTCTPKDTCGSDHKPVAATFGAGGVGTHPLTLGSYNVHGSLLEGETACKAKARFETAASNIASMNMDIVGVQEYVDYDDSKTPDCDGTKIKLLDTLNAATGGIWKATKSEGSYQQSQTTILYNSVVTKLMSDELKNVEGDDVSANDWQNTGICQSGSPIYHVAGFSDASYNTFYIANANWCGQDSSQRERDTQAILQAMGDYSGAKFVIGDTNSDIGQEVENVATTGKYGDARANAAAKNAAEYGTMAGNGKGSNIIDRIYYEEATVSDPSTYTTLNCKKTTTCGSDHRPITAVFPSVMVGSSGQDCSGDQKEVLDAGVPYYNVNACMCSTGGSGDSTMSGDTLAEQAFTFLVSTGIESNDGKPLNAAQAAGIIGNLMIETGGDTYDLKPEAVNSIGASGIVQWLGGRKTALDKFAEKKGGDWKDFKIQLQFMIHELETGYKKAVMEGNSGSSKTVDKGLKNITDISEQGAKDAADIVARYYEIPSIADAYPNREKAAARAFNDFKDNAPGTSSSVGSSGNCDSDSSTDGDVSSIGDIAFPLAIKQGDITTSGKAWTHTYHEDTCTYYYALDIMINMKRGKSFAESVPVIAMHDGKITTAKQGLPGYGRTVIIHGSDGLNYATLHVNSMKVKKGQAVKKGDTIALGVVNANGYHVHVDLSNGSSRPSACASCSPKICPAKGRFIPELRPKLKEIYDSMKD